MGEVVFQIIAILKAMEVEVLRERTKDGLTAAVPEEEMVAGKKATMKKGKLLPQPRYIKKINIQ